MDTLGYMGAVVDVVAVAVAVVVVGGIGVQMNLLLVVAECSMPAVLGTVAWDWLCSHLWIW